MTGSELKLARKKLGWTQVTAASRLGVSQGYLSMLEQGVRRVPRKLQKKFLATLDLPPVSLPLRESQPRLDGDELASQLGALGYVGFSHVRARKVRWNPADLLFAALTSSDLDSRLAEALPWLAWRYSDLDWTRLVTKAKAHDLQNRLGFVVTLGRQLAERNGDTAAALKLRNVEDTLRGSVLVRSDSLTRLTNAERRWLETERPSEAKRWNVLSDLSVQHLSHAT
jgi:transcriptional regulator with XRE-family HTH domain